MVKYRTMFMTTVADWEQLPAVKLLPEEVHQAAEVRLGADGLSVL